LCKNFYNIFIFRSEAQKYKALSFELNDSAGSSNLEGTFSSRSSCSSSPSPAGSLASLVGTDNMSNKGFHRLSKRPSVDSGIHLGSSNFDPRNRKGSGSNLGKDTPKLSRYDFFRFYKLRVNFEISRFDRSMSLPLNSPANTMDSSCDSSARNSPPRKMDFALCKC